MTFILSMVWRGAALFAAVSFGFLLACIVMDRKAASTVGPSGPDKTPGLVSAMESPRRTVESSFPGEFDPATGASLSSVRAPVPTAMGSGGNAPGLSAVTPAAASPRGLGNPRSSNQVDSAVEMVRTREAMDSADISPRLAGTVAPAVWATAGSSIRRTAGSIAAPARSTETAPATEIAPIVAPEGDVALPVAFQATAEDAKLTATQRKKLDDIQKRFVSDIEGGDQDPASPEYQSRWRKAQWTSDQQYRAMFGQQAYLQHQLATALADRRAEE